jgi:superfamily II DNA/RNA helicase
MNEFRSGNSRVLIATDIWGRGKLNNNKNNK